VRHLLASERRISTAAGSPGSAGQTCGRGDRDRRLSGRSGGQSKGGEVASAPTEEARKRRHLSTLLSPAARSAAPAVAALRRSPEQLHPARPPQPSWRIGHQAFGFRLLATDVRLWQNDAIQRAPTAAAGRLTGSVSQASSPGTWPTAALLT